MALVWKPALEAFLCSCSHGACSASLSFCQFICQHKKTSPKHLKKKSPFLLCTCQEFYKVFRVCLCGVIIPKKIETSHTGAMKMSRKRDPQVNTCACVLHAWWDFRSRQLRSYIAVRKHSPTVHSVLFGSALSDTAWEFWRSVVTGVHIVVQEQEAQAALWDANNLIIFRVKRQWLAFAWQAQKTISTFLLHAVCPDFQNTKGEPHWQITVMVCLSLCDLFFSF